MPSPLSGPGVGLNYPQNLYPSLLGNAPIDPSGNKIGLAPGETLVLPAGDWYVNLGLYNVLQFLDPVTNTWQLGPGAAWDRGQIFVKSDGFNCRVANLTGCVVSASVINGGTAYVQATTTITAIGTFGFGAAPTLLPIVGGALGETGTFTIDIPTKGAGYGIPPIIAIPPPPPAQSNSNGVGGIPAKAVAILGSGGSLTSVSIIDPGAGYPVAPIAVCVTSPFDPNLTTGITQASVVFSLTSSGVIMAALVTNNGAALNNGSLGSITLSIGGAGTSGSLTANVLQTVVQGSVTGAGTGLNSYATTFGGVPLAGTITNSPEAEFIAWLPRPAQIGLASVTANFLGTVYD